jgi:hypothetical protein
MSIFWLQPLALWALATLAIPILIHLLVRQRGRRLLFPSLRFVRATGLAAIRRRAISDWLLLSVRLAALACAVAALAGPVLLTSSRRETWNRRIARAIVELPAAREGGLVEGSFASATFNADWRVGDAVRDAVAWLERQPPAAREIVVVGAPRVGQIRERDIAAIPSEVGIRFVAVPAGDAESRLSLAAAADNGDGIKPYRLQVDVGAAGTRVAFEAATSGVAPDIMARAAASEQHLADAVLKSVLAEGLLVDTAPDRHLSIIFEGALESETAGLIAPANQAWMRGALERMRGLTGGERQGRLIVRAGVRPVEVSALETVARIVHATFAADVDTFERTSIPDATLKRWSRRPGETAADRRPGDEADRRWLWAAALVLLALEYVLRRPRDVSQKIEDAQDGTESEARVA